MQSRGPASESKLPVHARPRRRALCARHTLHRVVFCLLIGLLSSLLPGCQAAREEEQSNRGEEKREQGKSRSIAGRGTNVFLIVLDAASAEFFSSYGAGSHATPNIRKLARDGVVFETAYSQTATTAPSVASLITGLRATTHPVKHNTLLPRELPTAAAMLGEHGYHSYAVFGNPMAGAPRIGLDRGYDESVHAYRLQSTHDNPTLIYDLRVVFPEDLNEQIQRLIPRFELRGTFAYFHYLQPHAPYQPGARSREENALGESPGITRREWEELEEKLLAANETRTADPALIERARELYRANLRYVDSAIGELIEQLDAAGLYEESLIILTADHGEAFFGHRRFIHNWTLYDDMVRIPLIFKFPRSNTVVPRKISILVETIDLLPTLFDYLQLPIPERLEGDSLWPVIDGRAETIAGSEVVMTTVHRKIHAIRVGDFKLIHHSSGREELYNLRIDPTEEWDLIRREPDRASEPKAGD